MNDQQRQQDAMRVAQWLRSLPDTFGVLAVIVTIGSKRFAGARYTQTLFYMAGMLCVTRGDKQAGDTYTRDGIYLLGNRPERMRNRRHFCMPYDGREWYVSCHAVTDEVNEFHPFGRSFQIAPWDAPGKVDDGERFTYPRIPMTVEPVPEADQTIPTLALHPQIQE